MERQSPWVSIWTKPKETIAWIAEENPNRSLWLFAWIYGFCSLLNLFESMMMGNVMGPIGVFAIAFVVAPIYGWVAFAIWSWFVLWTGKWFKGEGTFQTVRASFAWSCVPIAINIPLWIILVLLFGHQIFSNFPNAHLITPPKMIALFSILVLRVILAVWSLIIFLNALAQVQNYSVLRAVFNVVVAAILLGILFFIFWSGLIFVLGKLAAIQ